MAGGLFTRKTDQRWHLSLLEIGSSAIPNATTDKDLPTSSSTPAQYGSFAEWDYLTGQGDAKDIRAGHSSSRDEGGVGAGVNCAVGASLQGPAHAESGSASGLQREL